MHAETDSGIANSFTDLMTSLAVIFILLLCAFMNNAFEEGQNTKSKILEKLQQELKVYGEQGIVVKEDKDDPLMLLILVPDGLLAFEKGKAFIKPEGNLFLNVFIPRLTDTIYSQDFRQDISSVVVEGHTDSDGTDTDNLKLSQNRSMSVVGECIKILESKSSQSVEAKNKIEYFLNKLSASGRGERDLIYENNVENMEKSRRVIFKIRVRSIEEKNFEKRLSNA